MDNLAQLFAAIDLAAYPPAIQAFLLATLTSMAADATGLNIATSVDGSPLAQTYVPGEQGILNVALFEGLPPGGYFLWSQPGYAVGAVQGSSNGDLQGGFNSLLLSSPTGNDQLGGLGFPATMVAGGGSDTLIGGAGTTVTTSATNAATAGAVLIDQENSNVGIFYTDAVFAFSPVLARDGLADLFFINGDGSSTVIGGGGPEIIDGGAGGGVFQGGGPGNNVIYGGTGASTLFGGGNNDLLMAGGANADVLIAGGGNETLSGLGSTGNNTFYGNGNDLMGGGSGNETFIGDGADTMIGGSGNDTFVAGAGADTMIAGSGADVFVFNKGFTNGLPNQYFGMFAEIENFGATDKVQLDNPKVVGYALNHALVAGGSTAVTLPDQTMILFQGITNLTAAAFM